LLFVLLIPAAATLTALFSVNQIMGHLGRFYFPSLPLLVVAGGLDYRPLGEGTARRAGLD